MDPAAIPGTYTAAYLEGRDEEILYRRMRDDMIQQRKEGVYPHQIILRPRLMIVINDTKHGTIQTANVFLEDAKAGILRKRKKRTIFKQLFGCGYEDEGRVVPARNRDDKGKEDLVR